MQRLAAGMTRLAGKERPCERIFMAVLPVRLFPDPVLRTRADEVTDFDGALEKLVEDMFDTMRADNGVGLAAPQVGVSLRLFVFDCGDGEAGHVVNPEWEPRGEEMQYGMEGCLSVPGVYGNVERYNHVIVRGRDCQGNPVEYEGTELLARCIQHETDHLNGIMFMKQQRAEDRKLAMAEVRNSQWFGQPFLHPQG